MSDSPVRDAVLHSKMGRAGIGILAVLVAVSLAGVASGLPDLVDEWNDPTAWLELPKSAMPSWANIDGSAEHMILRDAQMGRGDTGGVSYASAQHSFELKDSGIPNGIIYEYTARYDGSPLLDVRVLRPDGVEIELASIALPHGTESHARIFSTDASVRKLVAMQRDGVRTGAHTAVFDSGLGRALGGTYVMSASLYDPAGAHVEIADSVLIVSGGAYGIMGTDEMRRDIAVGLFWGTPLALFVGVTVAVASVVLGLAYGMYSGYRGGRTDESMMRLNDIVYAIPVLPFLIILAVTISSSIFVMVSFLVLFGWVGVAKVSRSMALQAKTRGYVEASKMMGRRDTHTILHHIMPQLLPYALASIAISVPAAITTEAGLSFLGLGDPEFPTWGQMLRDASHHGAAARAMWWWILPPGIMIAVTGMAFVFIGSAIDAAVNPRLRRA